MTCPRCNGPAEDLRGAGFSPRNLKKEGTCYWWQAASYVCNSHKESRSEVRAVLDESPYHQKRPGDKPMPDVLVQAKSKETEAAMDRYLAALAKAEGN